MMKYDEHEFGGDFEKIGPAIEELLLLLGRKGLSNGEIIDVIAGMLGFELIRALKKCGQPGVTGTMERFLSRIALVMPGKMEFTVLEGEKIPDWMKKK